MFLPERVAASATLPISVEDVKQALRVDGDDVNGEIERLIRAAVEHYEGWDGVLGISIAEQSWRQDYSRFSSVMFLDVGPVRSVSSIVYRDAQGQESTVAEENYSLRSSGGGRSYVRFASGFSAPSSLDEVAPISIQYVSGWTEAEIPQDIKTAITVRVQKYLDEAAQENWSFLDRAERDLTSRYRPVAL
ncbi:MAG: hypothetical protein H2043_06455 [Rhizobiales bacterium]|nr:hypothetical protein [Hyphomicrobiales bacterium]